MNNWDIYSAKSEGQSAEARYLQQSFEFGMFEPNLAEPKRKTKSTQSGMPPETMPMETLPVEAWPESELSEIRCKKETDIFHLLLPLLAKLNAERRWITLISPPSNIDIKLFAYHGIDVSRVLLIHPKSDICDTATMNKALKNGTSGVVIYWTELLEAKFLAQWRKSVKQGDCRGVIINHDNRRNASSSIAVSVNVKSKDDVIRVTSTKRFGKKSNSKSKYSFPIVSLGENYFQGTGDAPVLSASI